MTLEVASIHTFAGAHHVLHGVTFRVEAGEVVALLGRNGSGKTTTIRSIAGLSRPERGAIRLGGTEITGWSPYRIARAGVGLVAQGTPVFPSLSVEENLRLASSDGPADVGRALELFPELAAHRGQRAGSLSGGEQQMVSIARALAAAPALLLLDEPSNGLAPSVVARLRDAIGSSRRDGAAIVLSEQDHALAIAVADRVIVLEDGRVVMNEAAPALRSSSSDLRRYFAS